MEPSKEPISVRLATLYKTVSKRNTQISDSLRLTGEVLLDALCILYDDCENSKTKNLPYISEFISKYKSEIQVLKQMRVNIADFEVSTLIRSGNFGNVHIVKERKTSDIYAMKIIYKTEKLRNRTQPFDMERDILADAISVWLTKLYCAFQDSTALYLVMEYHPGGDLRSLLVQNPNGLPEKAIIFYISEMIEAINALHTMNFIHRDIKPENILIDSCGHIKLANFGSATRLESDGLIALAEAGKHVGTTQYMSPELDHVNAHGLPMQYGRTCDYWSLGVCAFEFTFRTLPFDESVTISEYKLLINRGIFVLPDATDASYHLRHFISSLMCREDLRSTYPHITHHRLFSDIDWTALRQRAPPFLPNLTGADDTSYFGEVQPRHHAPSIENFKKTHYTGRNLPFIGYTYVAFSEEDVRNTSPDLVKNSEKLERRTKQVDTLRQKVVEMETSVKEYNGLQNKFDKCKLLLQTSEEVRSNLERKLATAISETSALRHRLDFEKKDRGDLEQKALDLIKSVKKKWKLEEGDRTAQLKSLIFKQNYDLTDLTSKNKELDTKLKQLTLIYLASDTELQRLRNLQEEYEDKLHYKGSEKRVTLDCLQARLKLVVADSDERMQNLRRELSDVWNINKTLKEEWEAISEQNEQLQQELKTSEEESQNLRVQLVQRNCNITQLNKDNEQLQSELAAKNITEAELEKALQATQDNNKELETINASLEEVSRLQQEQYNELKDQFNKQTDTCNETIKQAIRTYETKVNSEISKATDKIATLETNVFTLTQQLLESNTQKEAYAAKIARLEELVAQFEAGTTQEAVILAREEIYKEQIQRLEAHVRELHEITGVKTQELQTTQTELWKKEKLLRNHQIDLRIMSREATEYVETIRQLKEEIQKLEEQIAKDQEILTAAGATAKTNWDKLQEAELRANNYCLDNQDLVKCLSEMKVKLTFLDTDNGKLREAYVKWQTSENELKTRLNTANTKLSHHWKNEEELQQKLARSESEVQNLEAELETFKTSYKALRESSAVVEQQMDGYDSLVLTLKNKEQALSDQILDLNKEIKHLDCELMKTQKYYRDKDTELLEIHHENLSLAQQIQLLELTKEQQKKETEKFKKLASELILSLTAAEEERDLANASVSTMTDILNNLRTNVAQLQEESSGRLTTIMQTRENNMKFSEQIAELKAENACLVENVNKLLDDRRQKEEFNKMRIMKLKERIVQLEKVADLLQQMLNAEAKKKTPLSTRLFGQKREPAQPLVLTYREIREMLLEERAQNTALKEQVLSLGGVPISNLHDTKTESTSSKQARETLDASLANVRPMYGPSTSAQDMASVSTVQRGPLPADGAAAVAQAARAAEIKTRVTEKLLKHRYIPTNISDMRRCRWCWLPMHNFDLLQCLYCNIVIHKTCQPNVPDLCDVKRAYLWLHYKMVIVATNTFEEQPWSSQLVNPDVACLVKTIINGEWTKCHLRRVDKSLQIFTSNPEINGPAPNLALYMGQAGISSYLPSHLERQGMYSTGDRTIDITTFYPNMRQHNCYVIEFLNHWDREHVQDVLQVYLKHKPSPAPYTILHRLPNAIHAVNIIDLANHTYILATDVGLYFISVTNKLIPIPAPEQIRSMELFPVINKLIILAKSRIFQVDLESFPKDVESTKLTVKFKSIKLTLTANETILGFACGNVQNQPLLCVATNKSIFAYRCNQAYFYVVSKAIINTLCTSLIVEASGIFACAENFIRINVEGYHLSPQVITDVLDNEDIRIAHTLRSIRSRPLAVICLFKEPWEYLICFRRYAMFVNNRGQKSRVSHLNWQCMPNNIVFRNVFLYVVFNEKVLIYHISPYSTDSDFYSRQCRPPVTYQFQSLKYLGISGRGIIVVINKQEIAFLDGQTMINTGSVQQDESSADVMP